MMSIPTPPVAKHSANQLLVGRISQLRDDGGFEKALREKWIEASHARPGLGSQIVAPKVVWVIVRDNHGEGLGEPFAAFKTKDAGDNAMALLSRAEGTFRLLEVPFRGL